MKEINIRRSVRQYSEKIIEDEVLSQLLRAAMQAPSAGNQQPWEFIVVRDRSIIKELSTMSPYAKCVENAAAVIILLGNKKRMKFPENWEQDMSAATENLLLEAVHHELGATWLGVAPLEDRMNYIRAVFRLKSHLQPFAMISLGYPKEEHGNHYVDRFDATRIFYDGYDL